MWTGLKLTYLNIKLYFECLKPGSSVELHMCGI